VSRFCGHEGVETIGVVAYREIIVRIQASGSAFWRMQTSSWSWLHALQTPSNIAMIISTDPPIVMGSGQSKKPLRSYRAAAKWSATYGKTAGGDTLNEAPLAEMLIESNLIQSRVSFRTLRWQKHCAKMAYTLLARRRKSISRNLALQVAIQYLRDRV
jgi:hypothetical protein